MKFRPLAAPISTLASFFLFGCSSIWDGAHAASDKPSHDTTYFANPPGRLYHFDDTTSVIYFDNTDKVVYLSENEGKSWDPIKDVPAGDAELFIEHPFDNNYAFILTRTKRHWRTTDRGRNWKSFEVDLPAAFTATPLSFHADPGKKEYIIYQGTKCEARGFFESICHDEVFYTKDAFSSEAKRFLEDVSRCIWAHSSKDFKHEAPIEQIFCVAFEASNNQASEGYHAIESSRLITSTDFFGADRTIVDFGVGSRSSRGVIALGVVSKFMVAALRDLTLGNNGEMILHVSVDAKKWTKAHFPHSSNSKLAENSYTIVESTTHSLAIDVQSHPSKNIGTLFVSNSDGTFFVESLKDTHRSDAGYVDFEELQGIDGVGLANVVGNSREVDGGQTHTLKLKTLITFDEGSSWDLIIPPKVDHHDKPFKCKPSSYDKPDDSCSLHLHSVSNLHNIGRVFSSLAPGYVMAVGSVGNHLQEYDDSDTFLSTDAGQTWKHVRHGAHKYEFGDQGNIMVIVDDEDFTDEIRYTIDGGKNWKVYHIGVKMRARLFTTIPDSTSQKFLLYGVLGRKEEKDKKHVIVFLDFAGMRDRQCKESDFEKWYARGKGGHECIMGHKQWYWRRKPDADCYAGNKFKDPEVHEENCPCEDFDYECDFGFILEDDKCVPSGPEPIPAGVCEGERKEEVYSGSSGYRLVPGNTCDKVAGKTKDAKIEKPCSQAEVPEGQVSHQSFNFDSPVLAINYFRGSSAILVQLWNSEIYQSPNEGYTWKQLEPKESFATYYMHTHANDRAYLITETTKVYYTTDGARSWHTFSAPLPPNRHGIPPFSFHPQRSDWLIWIGDKECTGDPIDPVNAPNNPNCRVEAWYSLDHGRRWSLIEGYVRHCTFARDSELKIDEKLILCESYRDKQGRQTSFSNKGVPLELVIGSNFFEKSKRRRLFEQVAGFTTFSEYLLVAENPPNTLTLDLQVSLNGDTFAKGLFPPDMRLDNMAYTVLESSTDAVFLHLSLTADAPWGYLLKSNSNGTYYGLSLTHVNRNKQGYVDFEKMIGINGVIVTNVVANADEIGRTGQKKIQTKISHNDGGSWSSLNPPEVDSSGGKYECTSTRCALQIHGYTERRDPRATYSSPSVVGLMLAVGSVGEYLAPYTESDTFLTRDAGSTWEEVHKDAHMWEFGDSGSILVIVNDEKPIDHVQYTVDEGRTWREYSFGKKLRVTSIMTVPADNSRKFLLIGYPPTDGPQKAVAVYLDFSSLTKRQCVLDQDDPNNDDFELWSPSETREEECLFGRRTLYHRRKRAAHCYIGTLERPLEQIVKNCTCTTADFECEYNHVRNASGECVLVPGALALASDDSCPGDAEFWYERTAYRKIPKSWCDGGDRPDRGEEHQCPGFGAHGASFWWTMALVPFAFTALVAFWYYRKGGYRRGMIRLHETYVFADSGPLSTLLSIPWFLIGLAGVAWSYVEQLPFVPNSLFRSRRGYRHVPVDEDAQVLRFEDED